MFRVLWRIIFFRKRRRTWKSEYVVSMIYLWEKEDVGVIEVIYGYLYFKHTIKL